MRTPRLNPPDRVQLLCWLPGPLARRMRRVAVDHRMTLSCITRKALRSFLAEAEHWHPDISDEDRA